MENEALLQIVLIENIEPFCIYSSCGDLCVSIVTDYKQTV